MFCYVISLTNGIRGLVKLTHFFDRRVIDGIKNERISRIQAWTTLLLYKQWSAQRKGKKCLQVLNNQIGLLILPIIRKQDVSQN